MPLLLLNRDIGLRYRRSMFYGFLMSVDHKNLYVGLIRLHILHHAAHEPVFGFGMIHELARHGYRLSAGTLYPVLHGLEEGGYLRSRVQLVDGRRRRVYRATPAGR